MSNQTLQGGEAAERNDTFHSVGLGAAFAGGITDQRSGQKMLGAGEHSIQPLTTVYELYPVNHCVRE